MCCLINRFCSIVSGVFVYKFLFFLIITLPSLCFGTDQRAPKSASEIGVINLQTIFTEALVCRYLHDKMSEMQKELSEKIKKMEQSTKQEELEVLLKKKSTPKKKEVLKNLQNLKHKNAELRSNIDEIKTKMSQISARAENKILTLTYAIIEEVAKEKRLCIVLARNLLLFAVPNVDITSIVLERLDRLVSSLNMNDFVQEK